MFIVFPF
jgi:hypothetical protein